MIAQPLLLLAFLLLLVAAARQAEERWTAIQKISSAVVCTLLGIALANLGVIPRGGEFLGSLSRYAIPYAIVLFVLSTRLADLRRAGPRMVFGFGLAGFGTFVGAFSASLLFAGVLGPETWKLGGTFAGAFFGGGLNFAAVGQGLEMTDSLFAGAFVVDNLSTVPWMLGQVALASALAAVFGRRAAPDADSGSEARKWTPTRSAAPGPRARSRSPTWRCSPPSRCSRWSPPACSRRCFRECRKSCG